MQQQHTGGWTKKKKKKKRGVKKKKKKQCDIFTLKEIKKFKKFGHPESRRMTKLLTFSESNLYCFINGCTFADSEYVSPYVHPLAN